jgi:hypothetical protein
MMSAESPRRQNKEAERKGRDLSERYATCCGGKPSGQQNSDAPQHKSSIRNLHKCIGRGAIACDEQGVD